MTRLRLALLAPLLPLAFAAVGCTTAAEDSEAADDPGDTSALSGTSGAACSDADLKRQFPSLHTSDRRFDEIGASAHAIVVDLAEMLGETVSGNDRCGPAITERTNELVGRSTCFYRAVDTAFDLKGLLATDLYKSSQAKVDAALRSKSDLRQYEIPLVGTDCAEWGKDEYLETLKVARVKFGLAKTLDGYKDTGN